MDNSSNIQFTPSFDNIKQEINFSGYNEVITIKTKTIQKLAKENISLERKNKKLEGYYSKSSKKKYIKFNISGETHLIKIKDLAQSLQVSKQTLITAKKEGFLKELIGFTLEAKHYHVSREVFDEAYEKGDLDKLRHLENLADQHNLPLGELLKAEKSGNLQIFLQQIEKVESQCRNIFAKLDALYAGSQGAFVTKDQNEKIEFNLTPAELNSIKSTVRTAFQSLARNLPQKEYEKVIPITNKHSVTFKSSGGSLEIIGLFGKFLGQGAVGVAVQRLNLLEGKWDTGEEAVIKIPSAADLNSEQIVQEVTILSKVHEKGVALGIQKPLRLVKDVFNGVASHCHLGAMYQADLEKGLTNYPLSSFEKKSIAYQLMCGLSHLHQLNITHGDIKPGNIFFNFNPGPNKNEQETRVYIGDFGGAIIHQTDHVPLQLQVSPMYRFDSDDRAAKIAHKNKDFKTYQEIQEKADIFAMCSVICSVCTGQIPYNQPIAQTYRINDHLEQDLKKAGLSQETIQLLIKGLSANYQERPSAALLLNAIGKDFQAAIPSSTTTTTSTTTTASTSTTSSTSSIATKHE